MTREKGDLQNDAMMRIMEVGLGKKELIIDDCRLSLAEPCSDHHRPEFASN